ncbi:MAG: Fic family protein [Psychromonas sp.]|nr:Fic family protein [Psychromonas sp.]
MKLIHPFLDGNGRVGRLLITLYLVNKSLLKKPSLYLSDFFERNRGSYYDALTRVRESNDMLHWIRFFLSAVIETANSGKQTFIEILALRQEIDGVILSYGKRAENAQLLINYLYNKPAVTVNNVSEKLAIKLLLLY